MSVLVFSPNAEKYGLEKLRIRPLFMQCKWTVLLRYFELAHLFPMHSLSAPWKHQKTADFFRCGTDFYMSLFSVLPSVLLSVLPSVAHHISGTVHHVILIFGTRVKWWYLHAFFFFFFFLIFLNNFASLGE